jgi:hypothetical protein
VSVWVGLVNVCVYVGVCVGGVGVGGGTVVAAAAVVEGVVEKEGVFSSAISVTNMSCPPYILK